MSNLDDEEFILSYDSEPVPGRGFDIEAVIYEGGSDSEIDDERDFEDVDDLDELLSEDREAESIISERSDIPEEDLRDADFEEEEEVEEEEDEEGEEIEEDGNLID